MTPDNERRDDELMALDPFEAADCGSGARLFGNRAWSRRRA